MRDATIGGHVQMHPATSQTVINAEGASTLRDALRLHQNSTNGPDGTATSANASIIASQ